MREGRETRGKEGVTGIRTQREKDSQGQTETEKSERERSGREKQKRVKETHGERAEGENICLREKQTVKYR